MTPISLRRALLRRLPTRGDERGSLPMAILIIIVGIGLAVLLLPMLITQNHSTTTDTARLHQLNAAEAGLDVALGQVRDAVNTQGQGITSGLPCAPSSAPVAGSIAGSAESLTYSVTIAYYLSDPTGQDSTWLGTYNPTTNPNGHGMLCSSGYGTDMPVNTWNAAAAQVPSFVLLSSTGTDPTGSRTVQAIYDVQTSNANIAGGTIYVYPNGTTNYCLDAGTATPSAGNAVDLQACVSPVAQEQAWQYNSDLSIELVSSASATYPNGLCLTDQAAVRAGKEVAGDAIVLEPCSAVPNAPWYQQWSVDDNAHLEGAYGTGQAGYPNINGLCINVNSQGNGVNPTMQTCAGTVTDTKQTWVPSPDVGAGMAGAANEQLVNYQQFGRCLDVTGQDPTSTFLIAYTCKQNPDPSQVAWNQKFTLNTSTGQFVTVDGGTKYCLQSPLSPSTENEAGGGPYVVVTPCTGGSSNCSTSTSNCVWTQYGATDASGNQLPSTQKYTVQDTDGYCLDLATNSKDFLNGQYSKVIVATCNGTTLQEWNAAPDVQTPIVGDYQEETGS